MDSFVIYPIERLRNRRKRVPGGKVNHLLGLNSVPDERLIDAVRNSGVTLTNGSVRIPWPDVLDIVLAERSRQQKRQTQ